MHRLLPIASGKGGVGKSVIAANLGIALAKLGKTVILVDLDLGASNLHTCLGIRNLHPGLGSYVWKTERKLSSLLLETGIERLWLIPGDNLLPGTANLEWHAKRRLLKELPALPADYVILDLGAGSAYNVVDFFVAATSGLLVICPEITSILNAYSFLKTAAFRILQRPFPVGSEERAELLAFAGAKTEGSGLSFLDFARDLAARHPERGGAALESLSRFRPSVVLNRGKTREDADLGHRLRDISRKNLGFDVEFSGFITEDEGVSRSIAQRKPLFELAPEASFSRSILNLAQRLERAVPESKAVASFPLGLEADNEKEDLLARLADEALAEKGIPARF